MNQTDTTGRRAAARLHPHVQAWIWKQGWTSLRPIQALAIDAVLDTTKDLLITAETAGGKTEAALLPLLSQVLSRRQPVPGFNLIYLSPLRALINDQTDRMTAICHGLHVPVRAWHSNVSDADKRRARQNPQGVLLITPESLEVFFVHRAHELNRLFHTVEGVVIDEYHALLDNERGMQTASLICRLEARLGRPLRRIALSATIGSPAEAAGRLNPNRPGDVLVVGTPGRPLRTQGSEASLELECRTVTHERGAARRHSATGEAAVANDIYETLRGSNSLVFTGTRRAVESYAQQLRARCERENVPNEFFPHHGSLAGADRAELEARLRDGRPTTAICTATLELGIDIGQIDCVGQIEAPFSVASLRQRLGRSGRRGRPPKLKLYLIESEPGPGSHPLDYLHLDLVRGAAMIELLTAGWCESPAPAALHLSTLTHQTLSVLAECGRMQTRRLHQLLCRRGPFRHVTAERYEQLVRQLADPRAGLVEAADESGTLRLGPKGDKAVGQRDFYAAFNTQEEYRIETNGRLLGTLPRAVPLLAGTPIIFSGQTWVITRVDDDKHLVDVVRGPSGKVPKFSGMAGPGVETKIVRVMFGLLGGNRCDDLDARGAELLGRAQGAWRHFRFASEPILSKESRHTLATGEGTPGNRALKVLLEGRGWKTVESPGFISAEGGERRDLDGALRAIADNPPSAAEALLQHNNLNIEKYHEQLGPELLGEDLASSRLDFGAARAAAGRLAGGE